MPDKLKVELTEETPFALVRTNGFPGYWGRGESIHEAVKNYKRNGGSINDKCYIVAVDRNSSCDPIDGSLLFDKRGPIFEGVVKPGNKVEVTKVYKA